MTKKNQYAESITKTMIGILRDKNNKNIEKFDIFQRLNLVPKNETQFICRKNEKQVS